MQLHRKRHVLAVLAGLALVATLPAAGSASSVEGENFQNCPWIAPSDARAGIGDFDRAIGKTQENQKTAIASFAKKGRVVTSQMVKGLPVMSRGCDFYKNGKSMAVALWTYMRFSSTDNAAAMQRGMRGMLAKGQLTTRDVDGATVYQSAGAAEGGPVFVTRGTVVVSITTFEKAPQARAASILALALKTAH